MTHGYEWFDQFDFVDLDVEYVFDYPYAMDYQTYEIEGYEDELLL